MDNPDDPKQQKQAHVDVTVESLIVELCPDIIISLTHLIPEYGSVAWYGDLYSNPYAQKYMKAKTSLHRKLKFYSAIYYLNHSMITKVTEKELGKVHHFQDRLFHDIINEDIGTFEVDENFNSQMVEEHAASENIRQHTVEQHHRTVQKVDQFVKDLDINMIVKICEL